MSALLGARARLQLALTLAQARQRRSHLGEAAAVAGVVALWCTALTANRASIWFGLALGICWYLWRDVTVLQARGVGQATVARWLDAAIPALEDSTALLLQHNVQGLVALQRGRVAERLVALDPDALGAAIPAVRQRVLPALAVVGALGVVPLLAPSGSGPGSAVPAATSIAKEPTLEAVMLTATPPAYTGLAPFTDESREVSVPQGTSLRWEVRTAGALQGVSLSFDDGDSLALEAVSEGHWRSAPRHARAAIYRVLADRPWRAQAPWRVVKITPDRPPRFDFSAPARTVTLLSGADPSPRLPLEVTVEDDYGLAEVVARLTLASGGGENVRFREQGVPLAPTPGGTARAQRFRAEFDLVALGMAPGDELYLHLEATDNRQPAPNVAASRTWIVRWPGESVAEEDDVGTMAMRVMPEYFRSQRQIIIHTQDLVASRGALSEEAFAVRSQAIAFDQKALRLRYGTFLGEEAVTDIGSGPMADDQDRPVHFPGDGHDHSQDSVGLGAGARPSFGQLDAVLQQFSHTHDHAEQATLFDPQTRDLLKAALAQMWDAELQLRLITPDAALPFEYEALDLIKRVQQRSRIYLRRVGFRPTPPDEGRRFSGELKGLALQARSRYASSPDAQPLVRRGLTALAGGAQPDLDGALLNDLLQRLREELDEHPELLNAIAGLEGLRDAPDCTACAAELARGLLRLAPVPPLPAQGRSDPRDAVAAAYERSRP